MKFKFSLPFLLLFFFSNTLFAQINEGKIVYKISYPGIDLPAEQKAMLPTESTCYFANNNSRTESDGFMGMKMVTLCVKEEVTMLMDVMGKKIAMHPKSEIEGVKTKEPQITYSDEVKTIAGYTCKKAVLSFDNSTKMTVWCAEEIVGGGSWGGNFKGLKGAPLEYSADVSNMSMTMTATKVSEEKVDKDKFKIPKGYEIMTPEQLQKQFK